MKTWTNLPLIFTARPFFLQATTKNCQKLRDLFYRENIFKGYKKSDEDQPIFWRNLSQKLSFFGWMGIFFSVKCNFWELHCPLRCLWMAAFIHLPLVKPKQNITLCHSKLNQVKFLCPFSPGQIHCEINLLNLPEIFRTPCSVAVCTCASEVPPGLIFFSLLRHVEWHFTCLHFFPVFAMA